MKNKIRQTAVILGFALALCGCGGKEAATQTVSEDKEPKVEIETEIIEEEPQSGPRSLLTNEETEKDLTKKRPLAVMIENTKKCLPHYGLSDAGIIYEIPAEGGITRYMALYDDYSDYDRLGNVRSCRPYYVYFASEYDAIYIHVGQSKDGEATLKKGYVDELNGLYGGKAFYRSSDRKQPHNTYLTTEGILADLEAKNINPDYEEDYEGHFKFAEDENLLSEGEDINTIKAYFFNNSPYFKYDASTKTYKRYAFSQVEPDAYSEDGINVTNIIFQEAGSKVTGQYGELDMYVVGSGTGKFFTRGKMVDIKWEKQSETAPTKYYMMDGKEIELNTGKTFICVVENQHKDKNSFTNE